MVQLLAPSQGSCKFNVDGATKGELGPVGIEGVIHDARDNMILAFSEPVG